MTTKKYLYFFSSQYIAPNSHKIIYGAVKHDPKLNVQFVYIPDVVEVFAREVHVG